MIEADPPVGAAPGERGWSVRELADRSGVSVRTIRYYQSEGLLRAPDRRGREARYDDAHLRCLDAITRLRGRGLALAAIREILVGGDPDDEEVVAGWLGLGASLSRPWTDDQPVLMGADELAHLLAGLPEGTQEGLERVGLIERRLDTTPVVHLVPSPGMLEVATASLRLGIPLEAGARIRTFLQARVRATAVELVERFTEEHSLGRLSERGPADLAQLLDELRPLSRRMFDLLFTHEMERAQRALLLDDGSDDPVGAPPEGDPT